MKKYICLALTLVIILCAFASCGTAPAAEEADNTDEVTTVAENTEKTEIDLDALIDEIISETGVSDPLKLPTESLAALYGLNPEDVESAAAYTTMDGIFPDEVVVVKAVSEEGANNIAGLFKTHLADVVNQAQNYDAESFAKLQKCEIGTDGLYVTMFISQNYEQMKTIFENQ